MVKLGYKLMSEEHGPADLVRNAKRAEQAGFDFAAISDHYFPWLEEQGHSPFAWSVLGAVAQATKLPLMTSVTCPIMRYHPAIIAQATATMALLTEGRFTLGLGAGERLNEHVVGHGWPGVVERHERLAEAIDIIQGLLDGEMTAYRGQYFRLDHARLFDRPKRKPAVVLAAGGPDAARLAGEKADGLMVTDADEALSSPTGRAAERGRATPKSRCAAPPTRTRPPRRRIAISAGRCRAGPCRPSCRTRSVRRRFQTGVGRGGRRGDQLRSFRSQASQGDRRVCPPRLRPHHPDADRSGARVLLRAVREQARTGAARQKARRALPDGPVISDF